MPIAQDDNRTTAFYSRPSLRVPVPPAPASQRIEAPAPPQKHAHRRVQDLWLALILVVALSSSAIGIAYLSGYADLAREGYRRAQLLGELRTEREKSRQYEQIKIQQYSQDYIKKRARQQGMIPSDMAQALTIGAR